MKHKKGHRRRQQRQRALMKQGGFSLLDSLLAAGDQPMRPERKTTMLLHMHTALDAVTRDAQPAVAHWRSLADAVNLVQALVELGWADDPAGVVTTAATEMGLAAVRYAETGTIRLSGAGVSAVTQTLATWETAMDQLTERQVLYAKRYAVRRIYTALTGEHTEGVQIVEVGA